MKNYLQTNRLVENENRCYTNNAYALSDVTFTLYVFVAVERQNRIAINRSHRKYVRSKRSNCLITCSRQTASRLKSIWRNVEPTVLHCCCYYFCTVKGSSTLKGLMSS